MKTDIKLAGVGGQGILSIATVLGEAATAAGLHLKQAEVHGMSQRGGDVQSDLRLSTDPIHSDLIPQGGADLILSMEPMEALRYLQEELDALPRMTKMDIDTVAKGLQAPRSANMVLLGMAARHLAILSPDDLRAAIRTVFGRKGEKVVEDNLKAFDAGYEGIQ